MTVNSERAKKKQTKKTNSPGFPKLLIFMTNMLIRYLLQVVIVLDTVYRMINNF